jgi:hypothetical protein
VVSEVANKGKATQKSILFDVMQQALTDAGYHDTHDAVVTVRDLYYSARELYYGHEDFKAVEAKMTALYEKKGKTKVGGPAAISMDYFSQTVLPEYEARDGKIERLVRDTRGHLYEPHTGNTIEVNTTSVWGYTFPHYVFDKMLYIEKEGEMAKVQQARIAERYDMAILTGKGFATEAIRDLISAAGRDKDYQVFVFHDADDAGYNIARTVREETKRMPGYSVDVIDLGLTYADAEDWQCGGEPYTRQKSLPAALIPQLTPYELAHMEGEKVGKNTWRAYRYELNSLKPVSRRMEYIEAKLLENGVREKVVPPDDYLQWFIEDNFDDEISLRVGLAIDRLIDKDAIVSKVKDELRDELQLTDAASFIRARFAEEPDSAWNDVVDEEHSRRVREAREDLAEMVRDEIVKVTDELDDE